STVCPVCRHVPRGLDHAPIKSYAWLALGTALALRALMLRAFLLVGQYFFLEAQPGIERGEEPAFGEMIGLEAGVGGAVGRSRPRYCLIARYEHAWIDHEGEGFVSRRGYDDIAAGLRILIPIVEPVRIYAEALGGSTVAQAELHRAD